MSKSDRITPEIIVHDGPGAVDFYKRAFDAVEVSRMVRKMDEMQMQLRERLQMYEMQIKRLESDLAARTEENQELIKMKIEMIRRQRESETVGEHREEEMAFS